MYLDQWYRLRLLGRSSSVNLIMYPSLSGLFLSLSLPPPPPPPHTHTHTHRVFRIRFNGGLAAAWPRQDSSPYCFFPAWPPPPPSTPPPPPHPPNTHTHTHTGSSPQGAVRLDVYSAKARERCWFHWTTVRPSSPRQVHVYWGVTQLKKGGRTGAVLLGLAACRAGGQSLQTFVVTVLPHVCGHCPLLASEVNQRQLMIYFCGASQAHSLTDWCEPAWPSGKAFRLVSGRTSVRFRCSALLSLQKLWSVDTVSHSSGAVWESRWTSWAVRPNEPSGFRGRKDLLNRASALVTTCP